MDVAADMIDQVLLMYNISLEGVQEHFIRSLRYKASLANAQVVTMGLLKIKVIPSHPIDHMWMSTRPMAITETDHITVDSSNWTHSLHDMQTTKIRQGQQLRPCSYEDEGQLDRHIDPKAGRAGLTLLFSLS